MKDNKKTTNHKDNKKKAEPVEKKVIGPKILKPSPARLKKQQPEATKERVQVTIPEAPKEEKRGNNRGRNMGKPGRKGKNQFGNGRSDHSDRSERKRRKNKNVNKSKNQRKHLLSVRNVHYQKY